MSGKPTTCPFCKEVFGVPAITHDEFLEVVEDWVLHWMNQTINEEDTKNYRRRALAVDANMRYGLARMLHERFATPVVASGSECKET